MFGYRCLHERSRAWCASCQDWYPLAPEWWITLGHNLAIAGALELARCEGYATGDVDGDRAQHGAPPAAWRWSDHELVPW